MSSLPFGDQRTGSRGQVSDALRAVGAVRADGIVQDLNPVGAISPERLCRPGHGAGVLDAAAGGGGNVLLAELFGDIVRPFFGDLTAP
jgi:hypothetical protein